MNRLVAVVTAVLLLALGVAGCAKPTPTLDFTAVQEGEGLVIHIETTNFKLPGSGHIHLRIDDGPEAMLYQETYTIPRLPPGPHKVFIELADKSHNPIGVDKTVEVEIKP